ncbi:hypothetical protein K2X33_01345, partial [bacterium]|nr:hypothetical protein [bacterium]
SIKAFREALLSADGDLHCGGHSAVIQSAFSSRGFYDAPVLSKPLDFTAAVTVARASASVAGTASFVYKIRNSNAVPARNVRVKIEPLDPRLHASTYMQAYGDLPAGRTISIGLSGGMATDFSVTGTIDAGVASGQRLRYRLRLMAEGAADVVYEGEVAL